MTVRISQDKLWNGIAGDAWIKAQALLDRMYEPFEELLLESVTGRPATKVLDVGCGTGATTIAIARQLGGKGGCDGIDISGPMIAVARDRARRLAIPARFIAADAETYPLGPPRYDAVVSRFGVMFFANPVAAFANLHSVMRSGADLRCIVWRSADENSFMTTAARAAAPFLPDIPNNTKATQGPFAFADPRHVDGILRQSGWSNIDIRSFDVTCELAESDLMSYLTRLGPLGYAFRGADNDTRARVMQAVRIAYEPYIHSDTVRFTAACWMVCARG